MIESIAIVVAFGSAIAVLIALIYIAFQENKKFEYVKIWSCDHCGALTRTKLFCEACKKERGFSEIESRHLFYIRKEK